MTKRKQTNDNDGERNKRSRHAQEPSLPAAVDEVETFQPFPFLRLPTEIQLLVVEYALREAREGSSQTREKGSETVGNLLCTCSQIHRLVIPLLYKRIEWDHYQAPWHLAGTFAAHPDYAHHVREFYAPRDCDYSENAFTDVLDVTDAIEHAHDLLPPADRRLAVVALSWPANMIMHAVPVLRHLQPLQCHLTTDSLDAGFSDDDEDEQNEEHGSAFSQFNLAKFVAYDGQDKAWLSRLTMLDMRGFMFDESTARLLSKLPNLTKLTLSGNFRPLKLANMDVFRIFCSTLITETRLRTLLVQNCSLHKRLSVQQAMGICIPSIPISWASAILNETLPDVEARQRIWHGCQIVEFCDRLEYSALPITRCVACPRCCAIEDQRQKGSIPFESDLSYVKLKQSTAVECDPAQGTRFGLCKLHFDEIFGELDQGESEATQANENSMRRKALEIMRWVLNEDDESLEIHDLDRNVHRRMFGLGRRYNVPDYELYARLYGDDGTDAEEDQLEEM